jgi:hypothetical protein
MVRPRRGASKIGCLLSALIVVAVAYFGFNVGEVYMRYYRYRDAMHQEGRFAKQNPDAVIRRRLRSVADSLGLPEDAGRISVQRSGNHITISAQYDEVVELPLLVRTLHFAPSYSGGM